MDTEAHELIAGYALDALEPADRARAKELLERSEEAREELRSLTETTAAMATAVSGPAPPPGLRAGNGLCERRGPGDQELAAGEAVHWAPQSASAQRIVA